MEKCLLYTYSLTKALYEEKKDYVDTFYPFILKVLLLSGDYLPLNDIKEKVEKLFGLCIPEHSLKSIITRAKKAGLLNVLGRNIRLTEKGVKYIRKLEPEEAVTRRINRLLEDFCKYLGPRKLSIHKVREIMLEFVSGNTDSLLLFFGSEKIYNKDFARDSSREYEDEIINYLEALHKSNGELWTTFKDIIYGSIISATASSENLVEINKKFRDVKVVLDSNIIFSLFEFDFQERNDASQRAF